MDLRDTLYKNPAVGGAIAVGIIALAAWITMHQMRPRRALRPAGQWFYHLESGELFVADKQAVPPIDAPGGGRAVRARVYGCGNCNEANLKPAVLEKYPPQVVKTLRSPLPVDRDSTEAEGYIVQREALEVDALLIASPPAQVGGEITWILQNNAAATAILEAADAFCGDKTPEVCLPQ